MHLKYEMKFNESMFYADMTENTSVRISKSFKYMQYKSAMDKDTINHDIR